MIILDSIITTALKWRMSRIEAFMHNPIQVQNDLLLQLISTAKNTEWGKKYGFSGIRTYEQFRNAIPVSTYEQLFPFIDRVF
ncbi:MAG: GH3 auxin-responsive promoter family protein, partial [Cytophagales bacterium]|nr:GH3 auxin-responsive promoter family protein [Cytophagales bacterium]